MSDARNMSEVEVAKTFLYAKNLECTFEVERKLITVKRVIDSREYRWTIRMTEDNAGIQRYMVYEDGRLICNCSWIADALSKVIGRVSQLSFQNLVVAML